MNVMIFATNWLCIFEINECAKVETCQILQMIQQLSGCFFLREDYDWMGSSGWSRHLLKWNTCLDVCPSTFRRWDQPVDLSLTFESHVTSLISWLTSAHYVELQYVSEKNLLCWTTSTAIFCISLFSKDYLQRRSVRLDLPI